MNKLKLIKAIVFILTFLLVFGMLTAIGVIYKKASQPKPQIPSSTLQQPEGSRIESFKVIEDKIYLLIKHGGKPDRIIIFSPENPANKPTEIRIN
ncbi:MAG: hypothetical protein E7018_06470 [Alphaproteobacteria bacterium]|nr:hypothetical protein [Alphaproteobacteria bacterium]